MEETTELVASIGALAQITAGEMDQQIATARRFPRDIEKYEKSVKKQVTLRVDIAASMTYAKPGKDDKGNDVFHIGPSVRFAEVNAPAWGNMRCGARVIDIGLKDVTAQGMGWDLENNFACFRERKASIVKRNGSRYPDSLVITVSNAAASIAYREAILKTIPKSIWLPLWNVAQDCVKNGPDHQREKAVSWFNKNGITTEQLLNKLKRGAVSEITPEDIVTLQAIFTAVSQGEQSLSEFFPSEPSTEEREESEGEKKLAAKAAEVRQQETIKKVDAAFTPKEKVTVKPEKLQAKQPEPNWDYTLQGDEYRGCTLGKLRDMGELCAEMSLDNCTTEDVKQLLSAQLYLEQNLTPSTELPKLF